MRRRIARERVPTAVEERVSPPRRDAASLWSTHPHSLNRRDFLPSALCTMINSPTFSVVNSPTS